MENLSKIVHQFFDILPLLRNFINLMYLLYYCYHFHHYLQYQFEYHFHFLQIHHQTIKFHFVINFDHFNSNFFIHITFFYFYKFQDFYINLYNVACFLLFELMRFKCLIQEFLWFILYGQYH